MCRLRMQGLWLPSTHLAMPSFHFLPQIVLQLAKCQDSPTPRCREHRITAHSQQGPQMVIGNSVNKISSHAGSFLLLTYDQKSFLSNMFSQITASALLLASAASAAPSPAGLFARQEMTEPAAWNSTDFTTEIQLQ